MNSAERHRKAHPNARPSTLYMLEQRDRTTERLRAELEAQRRVNDYRASVDHKTGENALSVIVGKLKVLSIKARELVS